MKHSFFSIAVNLLFTLAPAVQAIPAAGQQSPVPPPSSASQPSSGPQSAQPAPSPAPARFPATQGAPPPGESSQVSPAQAAVPPDTQPSQQNQAANGQAEGSNPEGSNYDEAIFQNRIPSEQLAFLTKFKDQSSGEVVRDEQFQKLMEKVIPDCMFHYGHDMPLPDAMETVLNGSQDPAQFAYGRYFVATGRSGPYLQGRGFLWIDMQEGIAIGGFYFHPTNGEPTPAVNIFSRQVKEKYLAMSQLPPAFAEVLNLWSADYRIPPITTRYFITGSNRKILLEHDEDYCAPGAGATPPENCDQMNGDAAEIDMNAANYVEQTHHATNATAWMITGEEQKVWLRVRVTTCGDLLACRIRLTRERVRVIIGRPPLPHRPRRH